MHPIGPELPISAHVACARVCRQLYVLLASHALVQATVGVGTVIIVYIGVAYTKGGGGYIFTEHLPLRYLQPVRRDDYNREVFKEHKGVRNLFSEVLADAKKYFSATMGFDLVAVEKQGQPRGVICAPTRLRRICRPSQSSICVATCVAPSRQFSVLVWLGLQEQPGNAIYESRTAGLSRTE